MSNPEPIRVRAIYRSPSHLPIWEVIDKAGIWEKVGIEVTSFEFCNSSATTERALFAGEIDFVSGNHISPYALVAEGKPIVSIASPGNSVNDRLISRKPVQSLAEIEGGRLGDTAIRDSAGGYHHPRGNHMLYIMRAGLTLEDVEWVQLGGRHARAARRAAWRLRGRRDRRGAGDRQHRGLRAGGPACAAAGAPAHDQRPHHHNRHERAAGAPGAWASGW